MFKGILKDKLNLALIAGIAICGIIVVYSLAPAVRAQGDYSTEINIVGKDSDSVVSQITFPPGLAGNPVSTPFNNSDGPSDHQVLSDTDSEPVVRLLNTSGGPLLVRLEITGWTGGVVVSEDYELVASGTDNVSEVNRELSSNGSASSVATGETIPNGGHLDLYLEVVLSSSEGVSGGSTLTILGEAVGP
jgi:hypothetical protein